MGKPEAEAVQRPCEAETPAVADAAAPLAESANMPETAEERAVEPELLTVQEFLATLTELLTPPATRCGLVINGAPVTAVSALNIRMSAQRPVVEIVTEEAAL